MVSLRGIGKETMSHSKVVTVHSLSLVCLALKGYQPIGDRKELKVTYPPLAALRKDSFKIVQHLKFRRKKKV